ncbi:hypothetical protein ABZ896_52215 [Streptomyces sp. NPDC047072]|uniref:hypothetical protein n=1 Tax=Streptomyces sp. NPDC047072 TaxID=3154809 RepID=UPI0033F183DC
MRRTARLRALSVVVPLLGLALAGPAPEAFADPTAEVSPSGADPGGTVTVSVSCDPAGATPPDTVDATSQAFEAVTVRLQLVPGNDDTVTGPAYSGTARIAAAQDLEGAADGVGDDSAWTVDGTCPAAGRAQGKPWSATFTVTRGSGGGTRPCTDPLPDRCTAPTTVPTVQRGVHAGAGGAFTDSVPALVAGGLLIAGAAGGAVYRLRRRKPSAAA